MNGVAGGRARAERVGVVASVVSRAVCAVVAVACGSVEDGARLGTPIVTGAGVA
jgi:hypothetical protein